MDNKKDIVYAHVMTFLVTIMIVYVMLGIMSLFGSPTGIAIMFFILWFFTSIIAIAWYIFIIKKLAK